ncbi:autophagy protein atg15 [Hyaloscypha variabilis]
MPLHRKPHPKCTSTGRVTARLLLSFLALSTPIAASIQEPNPILPPLLSQPASPTPAGKEHAFTLRHVFHHGDLNRPALHRRHDVPQDESPLWIESDGGMIEEAPKPLVARSTPMRIHRLKDRQPSVIDPMVAAAREYSGVWASQLDAWSMDEVDGPDVSNVETILTFAQMAANAYAPVVDEGDWKDVNGGYNRTDDYGFGWDSDGLRGYLYADEMNSTIVIGVKGTTLAIWDGDGTTTNDKENDNLFFSCCCGQQGNYLYRQVCDCAQGTYTCNVSCLKHSLRKENRYYAAARYLYSNVTALFPDANVWMAGHSLGGSVSAMIGLTYGVPALTFQAVPDALPATRLGLPVPPGVNPDKPAQREYTGAYHFGHNADPIYMGTCNGATASCSYAGYALESACHSGRECVWDVVNKNGTRVSVITHKIIYVIESVIKKWKQAPECNFTPECYDCPLWKEVTGNKTESSTSTTSSSTKTRTRTSTCQTPGWWGCLDETTTTNPVTSTSTTTTTTTSTCKTPGWFGCNDETTTTTKPHTSISTPTITETCKTPGWFGCNDPTSTSPITIPTSTPTCSTPGYIWGCKDATTTTTQSHSITSPPAMPTPTPSSIPSPPPRHNSHCVRRSWLGFCKEWSTNYVWREEI